MLSWPLSMEWQGHQQSTHSLAISCLSSSCTEQMEIKEALPLPSSGFTGWGRKRERFGGEGWFSAGKQRKEPLKQMESWNDCQRGEKRMSTHSVYLSIFTTTLVMNIMIPITPTRKLRPRQIKMTYPRSHSFMWQNHI